MEIVLLREYLNFEFNSDQELLEILKKEYSYEGFLPKISIDGSFIRIEINTTLLQRVMGDLEKAMTLCNKGAFEEAKRLLKSVVSNCPLHADAYRMLAQIYMEEGDYNKALDTNIEALRVDPGNLWALLLMGNIYTHQNDVETADMYYQKVLTYHPGDIIALNNLAANYTKRGDYDKAIDMFREILKKDDTYLNTYYGLGLCYERQKKHYEAFEVCADGMRKGVIRPEDRNIRMELQKMMFAEAHAAVKDAELDIDVRRFIASLEDSAKTEIRLEESERLEVSAKMQYGKSHGVDYNKVIVNRTKPYHEHLMMHELMHLEMNLAASKANRNMVVTSNKDTKHKFRTAIYSDLQKIGKSVGSVRAEELLDKLYAGVVLQSMNCSLDLLVEDKIYREHKIFRPIQFLSLLEQEKANVEAIKNASNTLLPKKVVAVSRIMNMVTTMHMKELYGIDLLHEYGASKVDMNLAKDMYEEYKAYMDDCAPGDEYDLMMYFIESLNLENYMEVMNENDLKHNTIVEEAEPEKTEEEKAEVTAEFNQTHKDGANPMETMMMSMYMLGAMQYMESLSPSEVNDIAMQIAIQGMSGISPEKKGYRIPAIKDKEFGGYEFLAYYYVSWAIAHPHKVDSLRLPFKTAYEAALKMYNDKKGQQ